MWCGIHSGILTLMMLRIMFMLVGFLIPIMPIYKLRTHRAGQLVNYDDDVFAGDSREQLRGSTKSSTGHFSPGSVGGAQISPRPPDMSQFFTRYSHIKRCKKIYVHLTLFCLISLFTTWSGAIPQKCSQNPRLSITSL